MDFDMVVRVESYDGNTSSIEVETWEEGHDEENHNGWIVPATEDGERQEFMFCIVSIRSGRVGEIYDMGYVTEQSAARHAKKPCLTSYGMVY